jgi:hypothetical protein
MYAAKKALGKTFVADKIAGAKKERAAKASAKMDQSGSAVEPLEPETPGPVTPPHPATDEKKKRTPSSSSPAR